MMMDIETNFLYNSWYVAGWSYDFEHSLQRLLRPTDGTFLKTG